MTSDQKNALLFIHGKGQATAEEFARALGLNERAVGDLLYELRTAKLTTDSTTRPRAVTLTLAGHRAIPQLKRGESLALPLTAAPVASPHTTSGTPTRAPVALDPETKSAPPPPKAVAPLTSGSAKATSPAEGGAGEVRRLPVVLANLPIERAPGVMLDIDLTGPAEAGTTLQKEIAHARAPDESPAPSGEIDGSATPKITQVSEHETVTTHAKPRTEQREGSPPKQDTDPRRDDTAGATSEAPYVQNWSGPPLTLDHAVAAMESLASGEIIFPAAPTQQVPSEGAKPDADQHPSDKRGPGAAPGQLAGSLPEPSVGTSCAGSGTPWPVLPPPQDVDPLAFTFGGVPAPRERVAPRSALRELRPNREPAHISGLVVDELLAIAGRCDQRAQKAKEDALTLRRAVHIVASESGTTTE